MPRHVWTRMRTRIGVRCCSFCGLECMVVWTPGNRALALYRVHGGETWSSYRDGCRR